MKRDLKKRNKRKETLQLDDENDGHFQLLCAAIIPLLSKKFVGIFTEM